MKGTPGIIGPAPPNPGEAMEIPECVQFKTQKDQEDFKVFVEKVVKATNNNCKDLIAEFIQQQNAAMTRLVKKLGSG